MPFTVKINVALREHICQKIGSERVNIMAVFWPSKCFSSPELKAQVSYCQIVLFIVNLSIHPSSSVSFLHLEFSLENTEHIWWNFRGSSFRKFVFSCMRFVTKWYHAVALTFSLVLNTWRKIYIYRSKSSKNITKKLHTQHFRAQV